MLIRINFKSRAWDYLGGIFFFLRGLFRILENQKRNPVESGREMLRGAEGGIRYFVTYKVSIKRKFGLAFSPLVLLIAPSRVSKRFFLLQKPD